MFFDRDKNSEIKDEEIHAILKGGRAANRRRRRKMSKAKRAIPKDEKVNRYYSPQMKLSELTMTESELKLVPDRKPKRKKSRKRHKSSSSSDISFSPLSYDEETNTDEPDKTSDSSSYSSSFHSPTLFTSPVVTIMPKIPPDYKAKTTTITISSYSSYSASRMSSTEPQEQEEPSNREEEERRRREEEEEEEREDSSALRLICDAMELTDCDANFYEQNNSDNNTTNTITPSQYPTAPLLNVVLETPATVNINPPSNQNNLTVKKTTQQKTKVATITSDAYSTSTGVVKQRRYPSRRRKNIAVQIHFENRVIDEDFMIKGTKNTKRKGVKGSSGQPKKKQKIKKEPGQFTTSELASMKCHELKEELTRRGMRERGSKMALYQRLKQKLEREGLLVDDTESKDEGSQQENVDEAVNGDQVEPTIHSSLDGGYWEVSAPKRSPKNSIPPDFVIPPLDAKKKLESNGKRKYPPSDSPSASKRRKTSEQNQKATAKTSTRQKNTRTTRQSAMTKNAKKANLQKVKIETKKTTQKKNNKPQIKTNQKPKKTTEKKITKSKQSKNTKKAGKRGAQNKKTTKHKETKRKNTKEKHKERLKEGKIITIDQVPRIKGYQHIKKNQYVRCKRPKLEKFDGCNCEDGCSSRCNCSALQMECFSIHDLNTKSSNITPCGCQAFGMECCNQSIKNRRTSPICVQKTKNKGYGVFALEDIPPRTFICEYAGEVITEEEKRKRMKERGGEQNSYFMELHKVKRPVPRRISKKKLQENKRKKYLEKQKELNEKWKGNGCLLNGNYWQTQTEQQQNSSSDSGKSTRTRRPSTRYKEKLTSEDVRGLPITQLRKELRDRNADSEGKKAELTARLKELLIKEETKEMLKAIENAEESSTSSEESSSTDQESSAYIKYYIDACAKGNIGRFVNHSCDPNAEIQRIQSGADMRVGIYSRALIKKSEEITYNYSFRYDDEEGKEACQCNSKNCKGTI